MLHIFALRDFFFYNKQVYKKLVYKENPIMTLKEENDRSSRHKTKFQYIRKREKSIPNRNTPVRIEKISQSEDMKHPYPLK